MARPKHTEEKHSPSKNEPGHAEHKEPVVKDEPRAEGETQAKGDTKSIVPAKYAGKYKGGHAEGDKLGELIVKHASVPVGDTGRTEFSYDRFFVLAKNNGVEEKHVKPFEDAIASNAQGVKGRARMTLRNRMETVVRERGHFVDYDGHKHDIVVPPRPNVRPPQPKRAEEAKEPAAA